MIVFDLQAVQSAAHGERGIARFVGDLARTLAAEHPDAVDVFAWNDRFPSVPRLHELGLGDRLRPFSELRRERVDLVHVNSPFEHGSVADLALPVHAGRTVVTCYDLIPYRFPEHYLARPGSGVRYRARLGLLVAADHVVTDSASAADDAHELLGIERRRLTVIGAGVTDGFVPPTTDRARRMELIRASVPGVEDGFVLVPSGIDWRKNVEGSIVAYAGLPAEVRARHQFVLACRVDDEQRRRITALCERLGVADRVVLTGFVADDVLVALYQTCELVMFPSKYEGFGLPVLEARRCGARVICSNVSSLPEVLREPAAMFNPWVADEMTAVLERALTDPAFGAVLDAVPDPGFTWSTAALRLVDVYDRVRPVRAVSAPGDRLRLAVASPLPPAETGVASHTARLLEALSDRPDVEVAAFVDGDSTASASRIGVPVHDLATLPSRWAAGEIDDVVYCIGNHALHRPYLDVLRLVPGAVLIHDVRLSGPLPHLYGDDVAPDDVGAGLGVVAGLADGVLVQSEHARALAASVGVAAIDVGPHHCPHLPPPTPSDGGVWVVTAGVADESKRTETFVEAVRRVTSRRPEVRGAVIGRHAGRFVDDRDATVVAVEDADDDAFVDWLARATVVVQLRARSIGESSGALATALAAGAPTIASDVGAMRELPDDAVVKVAADIDPDRLADTIETLVADADRRTALAARARAFAAEHPPESQAATVLAALRARSRH